MYEPITVVKVRKETKVTVPAGGWVLIGQPDEPLHLQIARRAALVKDGNVNDDFSQLVIGRVQGTHPVVKFMTAAENKAAQEAEAENSKNLENSHEAALKRQKDQATTKQDQAAALHAEKLAEINSENDAIRNRDKGVTPKSTVQLETIPDKPAKK